jgi:hypothetical protein
MLASLDGYVAGPEGGPILPILQRRLALTQDDASAHQNANPTRDDLIMPSDCMRTLSTVLPVPLRGAACLSP